MNSPLIKHTGARQAVSGELRIGSDVVLVRSAANTLALRNGTNPQTLIVNGTWTDPANFRRLRLTMDALGAASLFAEGLGTGATGNSLSLFTDGINRLTWAPGSSLAVFGGAVQVLSTGSIRFGTTRSRFQSPADAQVVVNAADGVALSAVQSLYERWGAGSPEGVVIAPVGTIYHRTDGGAGTSNYFKESGTGATGWVAK